MTRVVFQLRCSEGDLARWRDAAGDVPLAVWLRRAANDRVDLDAALRREDRDVQSAGEWDGGLESAQRLRAARAVSPAPADLAARIPGVDLASKFRPDPKGGRR